MATYDEIVRALRNAHAAGDTASAQRLAQLAHAARQGALTREPAAGTDPRLSMAPGALPAAPPPGASPADSLSPGGFTPDPGMGALLTREGQAARAGAAVEPAYDPSGIPIPPEIPAWAGAARVAAGEGVMTMTPDTPLPTNPEGRNWLRSWADDGNPDTMSRGEQAAAWLNRAGEAITLNAVGDEAAGWFDEHVLGRGDAAERAQLYRDQEAQYREQYPTDALSADIAGGVIGPGFGAARFIGQGVGTLARMGRGAVAGGVGGAVSGAMDPLEGLTDSRTLSAVAGGVAGATGGAALTGLGQGFARVAQALVGRPGGQEAAATVAGLKDTAHRLYEAAEASGAVLPQARVSRLATDTAEALAEEGYNARLHPRLSVVLDELRDVATGDQSIARMDQLRRIASNAAQSLQPDERRLGSLVIDHIDDAIQAMGEGSAPLRAAREVWGRMRRLQTVERIIENANLTDGSFERALASGFRSFLRNPRNLRGFNEAERGLMREVARGSSGVRALRGFAGLFAPNSVQGVATTVGVGFGGVGPAALALPAASSGARAVANAMVRSQGNALRGMVGMDDAARAAAVAALRPYNPLTPLAGGPPTYGTLEYAGAQ